jgi:hypothetical protein
MDANPTHGISAGIEAGLSAAEAGHGVPLNRHPAADTAAPEVFKAKPTVLSFPSHG